MYLPVSPSVPPEAAGRRGLEKTSLYRAAGFGVQRGGNAWLIGSKYGFGGCGRWDVDRVLRGYLRLCIWEARG